MDTRAGFQTLPLAFADVIRVIRLERRKLIEVAGRSAAERHVRALGVL